MTTGKSHGTAAAGSRRLASAHPRARAIGRSLAAGLLLAGSAALAQQAPPQGFEKIEHVVVLYLENRSFDHLFGNFPGAEGLEKAGAAAIQTDETGKPMVDDLLFNNLIVQ